VRANLGTLFNGWTSIKLGSFVYATLGVQSTIGWMALQLLSCAAVGLVGTRFDKFSLVILGIVFGMVIAGQQLIVGQFWPVQLVLSVEIAMEICARLADSMGMFTLRDLLRPA
jgi:hypothetical protein